MVRIAPMEVHVMPLGMCKAKNRATTTGIISPPLCTFSFYFRTPFIFMFNFAGHLLKNMSLGSDNFANCPKSPNKYKSIQKFSVANCSSTAIMF